MNLENPWRQKCGCFSAKSVKNTPSEVGTLLNLRSKYDPGGMFDPDWKPSTGPPPDRVQTTDSWATWQVQPGVEYTPPPRSEPTILVPEPQPRGLFGPRSPRASPV